MGREIKLKKRDWKNLLGAQENYNNYKELRRKVMESVARNIAQENPGNEVEQDEEETQRTRMMLVDTVEETLRAFIKHKRREPKK